MLDENTLAAIAPMADADNGSRTAIPGLDVWTSDRPLEDDPGLFEPMFYIVLQGSKRMTITGGTYEFGPGDCAVSALGLPFRCEVRNASPAKPYVGIGLSLEPAVVASVLLDMPETAAEDAEAFAFGKAGPELRESLERLLRLLLTPADIAVLAPLARRELCYRLLQGPLGATIRQIVSQHGHLSQVRRGAEMLRASATGPVRITEIAASVGMSATSFHRHFRKLTGQSPLAYQRQVRLLEAQRRLANGEGNVTSIAYAVGYRSPAQFSREYKRALGTPPSKHIARANGMVTPKV